MSYSPWKPPVLSPYHHLPPYPLQFLGSESHQQNILCKWCYTNTHTFKHTDISPEIYILIIMSSKNWEATKDREEIKGTTMQKMTLQRRREPSGTGKQCTDDNGRMEGTDGWLHPAMDGQSLSKQKKVTPPTKLRQAKLWSNLGAWTPM